MAIITFPDGLYPSQMSWSQQRMAAAFQSIFGSQTIEGSPPRWAVSMAFDRMLDAEAGVLKALLMRLRGSTDQLALCDMGRPVPMGTLRGVLTLNGAHAQGATTLAISAGAGQAGKTVLPGDLLGLGNGLTQQVIMATEPATADGLGNVSVKIEAPLRNAFATGTSVAWDKPKALFRRQNLQAGWEYGGSLVSGFSLDLVEDWRP